LAQGMHPTLGKMAGSRELYCRGMSYSVEDVDKTTVDENSTVECHLLFDRRQRIYFSDGTFPDATMSKEDETNIMNAVPAQIDIDEMRSVGKPSLSKYPKKQMRTLHYLLMLSHAGDKELVKHKADNTQSSSEY